MSIKIKLVGKNLEAVRPLLGQYGMVESDDFELVVTHGGDGALLGAEREFPGVPKLPIRDAATAEPCELHRIEGRLRKFSDGLSLPNRLPKFEGTASGRRTVGINDVFVHSVSHTSALRYRVRIDGVLYASEVLGDGVGISSVHGSTAYYRSITHSIFRVGMGLAFSNSTESVDHMVLDDNSIVEVEIIRGPGILLADNAPEGILLNEGKSAILRKNGDFAVIYDLADFMCERCRRLRHPFAAGGR